jgi:hypothetical protein
MNVFLRQGAGRRMALFGVATAGILLPVAPEDATAQSAGAADRVAASSAIAALPADAQNMTCKALKDELERTGSLPILYGPKGFADTFYGPGVPQCPFYQRPVFSFVTTRDGLCGVGYICVDKFGSAGGSR